MVLSRVSKSYITAKPISQPLSHLFRPELDQACLSLLLIPGYAVLPLALAVFFGEVMLYALANLSLVTKIEILYFLSSVHLVNWWMKSVSDGLIYFY